LSSDIALWSLILAILDKDEIAKQAWCDEMEERGLSQFDEYILIKGLFNKYDKRS